MDNSQGLVKGYVDKVRQTAVKAQTGESAEFISEKMKEVINEAHQHFSIWINGTPEENWRLFIGQINFTASLKGDERFIEALNFAVTVAKNMHPPKRPEK